MGMRNYICWNPRIVHQIIKIDAEAVGDTVFRAVHSPHPMLMSTVSAENLTPGTDQDFLTAFTNPDIPEIFSLLLGDSGMGKTHFIHWLRLHVAVDEKTRVVNIHKVGTSLRNIVEKIIGQLPEAMQGQYLKKLTTMGGETHTQEQLQEKLLDSLAQAVSVEATLDAEQDLERKELLRELPSLFRDPHIRSQWFLAKERESIIKELTRHVFEANKAYDRREGDRRFEAEDFLILGVRLEDVSLEARTMLTYFRAAPHLLDIAAELTNQCLDAAIGEALSFSGEDLVALVAEVRKHLHAQGLSLILYIEDLSRMQGVDKALLDALTTPSDQGDQMLCPIRWIAAMTTGYFDRLEATITTRINLMGKVEAVPQYWGGQQAQSKLATFMGRYLNAVRLGPSGLNAWDHASQAVPNACDACEHKDSCHDTFGTADGFGLYPFTVEALWNMADRSAPPNEFWFKPRRLLKSIVTPMLSAGQDIVEGRFPSSAMIDGLGGGRLDALEQAELYQIAGADADRHLALQELWQPSSKIVPFSESLLQAFNLRPLHGKAHTGSAVLSPPPLKESPGGADHGLVPSARLEVKTTSSSSQPTEVADSILEGLRDWGNGKSMADTVATAVRSLVFDSVVRHIDWDLGGVARTLYVGQNQPFRPTSIVFKRQATKSRAPLQLQLPLFDDAPSFSRTVTALQGLYLFNKYGNWNFKDGYRYFIHSQSCLEEWAGSALDLVRSLPPIDENWNALDAATELLAVGATLSGNIGVDSARVDIWSGLWGSAPAAASERLLSSELQRIANDIAKKWEKLQGHVKARSSGTKGGQIGNFLCPEERERVLSRLVKNNWKLLMNPDSDAEMHNDFTEIAVLYQKVAQSLPSALEAEAEMYRSWLVHMEASFGTDMAGRGDILNVFKGLQQALNNGAFLKREADRFQHSLDDFTSVAYNEAWKRAGMVAGTEPEKLLPYLFAKKHVANAMRKATSLAEVSDQFLADVSAFYEHRMDELEGVSGDGLQACWDEIGATLALLESTLERLAYEGEAGRQEL